MTHSESAKGWRLRNPERAKEIGKRATKKWRLANPEKVRAQNEAWKRDNPEKILEYRRRDYVKHQERRKETAREYRKKNRAKILTQEKKRRFLLDHAKSKPCMDCGVWYPPCVMDFDHRDPSTKEFSIGQCANKSLVALQREIWKCDVVCANCHRIRTMKRVLGLEMEDAA